MLTINLAGFKMTNSKSTEINNYAEENISRVEMCSAFIMHAFTRYDERPRAYSSGMFFASQYAAYNYKNDSCEIMMHKIIDAIESFITDENAFNILKDQLSTGNPDDNEFLFNLFA